MTSVREGTFEPNYTTIERQATFDRFPQRTLEYLSLPVLADPFWGRLLWLLTRRGGKHSKHRISKPLGRAGVRTGVPLESCKSSVRAEFHDIGRR